MFSKHVQKCTVTSRQNITTPMLHFSVTAHLTTKSPIASQSLESNK